MLKIDIDVDTLKRHMQANGKQAKFAAASSLTRMAVEARERVKAKLPAVFDRPSWYTLNSMRIAKATKARLESAVLFKGGDTTDPKADAHYLQAQIKGGTRHLTKFEGRLRAQGYLRGQEKLVPTRFASPDGLGGVAPAQKKAILMALAQNHPQTQQASKRGRGRPQYFWSDGPGTPIQRALSSRRSKKRRAVQVTLQKLARGVWQVTNSAGKGSAVRPIFFAASPSYVKYAKRFDFRGIVEAGTAARFAQIYREEFQKATATARP